MAVKVRLPDDTEIEAEKGTTVADVVKQIGEGLYSAAVAAKLNDKIVDLSTKINENSELQVLTFKDKEGKDVFLHSAAHVLAQAVKRIFPDAKLTIGPAVEDGFYYDFDVEKPFTPEDLKKIEEEMKKIVKEDITFERIDVTKEEAKEMQKDEPYKLEMIDELGDEACSLYKHGELVDLCRGPHVRSTGQIKAFKLTKIAGAYWRGKAENQQLQRIYGVAFPDKKELKEYLEMLREAEKRDHRKIGKELKLFSLHEEAPGFPFFHPKGMVVFNKLIEFWKEVHNKAGYVEIKTPIILSRRLWEKSGHWKNYGDDMYYSRIDEEDYAIKPMNCPGGMLMYNEEVHSYRELPMRVGEIGFVHRHELSGTLGGLFRVRAFHQDDAHIYMTEEQIQDEIEGVISLVDEIYSTFGLTYHMELSTKPDKAIGTDEQWDKTTSALKAALESTGREYVINEGDGAFYGPKIDFHIKDCLGRTWQCGTIQLDMAQPENFDLTYEGADSQRHRPVMIHRTVYGSLERFMGILIEHYAGKFPLWLSPVQVKILTVADRFSDAAEKAKEKLASNGLRVEIDKRSESVSKKVREAQLQKVNYVLVIGEKEAENNTATVRTRENEVIGTKDIDEFAGMLQEEVLKRK
ncbi:MAG: threonine--tRNA ligase [Candidatus Woesearchaeota archaeon]